MSCQLKNKDNMICDEVCPPRRIPPEKQHSNAESKTINCDEDWLPEDDESKNSLRSFSNKWTRLVKRLHSIIVAVLKPLAVTSARHPRKVILSIASLSVCLMVVGLKTNFNINVDEGELWTPKNSLVLQHEQWVEDPSELQSGSRRRHLAQSSRYVLPMIFHANGKNVLGMEEIERMFDILDAIKRHPDYETFCGQEVAERTGLAEPCDTWGPLRYWENSRTKFHEQVATDDDVKAQLSEESFPDGIPVPTDRIMGHAVRSKDTNLLQEAASYSSVFRYPRSSGGRQWGEALVEYLLKDEARWRRQKGSGALYMEVVHGTSFGNEFLRAIYADLPLVPVVFVIMSVFTCAMFWKPRNSVKSRSLLGISAVVAVLLSLLSSFGILFIRGIPFTSVTQLLPFILFGIGLDDAFVIMGSYQRTNPHKHIEERIEETIQDIGAGITVTSLTSTVAFGLGCMSEIPAVYWLCLYAFPSVILVYFYHLTFFVACISLDEQRITDNRRDCFTCFTVLAGDSDESDSQQASTEESEVDRFMERYAEVLLRPSVKIVVVSAFALLSAFCALSASKIRQKFDATELLPDDSHVLGFVRAQEKYVDTSEVAMTVYFRDVDQSLPEVRQDMYDFVNELVNGLVAVEKGPDYFWSKDLDTYVNVTGMQDKPFAEQLDNFFQIDPVKELYGPNVKRDGEGKIIYSKVSIDLDNLDLSNARQQMETLEKQREITNKQPINKGRTRAAFFTFMSEYKLWSFYESCVNELTTSAVIGVATVTLVAMFLIPHWTAAVIVFPMMCVLYIDMLGMMNWAGVSIDPVSYIILAMSIGLLVDFLMHVLLRYYELPGTRQEKTVVTLRTMGSSILLGGITTFLGTVPLIFSTSQIFFTVFIAFMALVFLGATHGLILLPVILSTVGTEDQVSAKHEVSPPTLSAHVSVQVKVNKKATEDMYTSEDEEIDP